MLPKLTKLHTPSKRPLRASERKEWQRYRLRKQSWLRTSALLIIIIVAWGVDRLFINSDLLMSKSVALGAGLSWLTQNLFIWFVFHFSSGLGGRRIVNQLYVGQIIKWLVLIIGFSVIFLTVKPLSASAVLIGFIVMQTIGFLTVLRTQ